MIPARQRNIAVAQRPHTRAAAGHSLGQNQSPGVAAVRVAPTFAIRVSLQVWKGIQHKCLLTGQSLLDKQECPGGGRDIQAGHLCKNIPLSEPRWWTTGPDSSKLAQGGCDWLHTGAGPGARFHDSLLDIIPLRPVLFFPPRKRFPPQREVGKDVDKERGDDKRERRRHAGERGDTTLSQSL
ncbi:hypothetical protein WMY93_026323 [Mugilogobius chulae]|uniref:Uncharacterized protein n=1 Tax=Mugilogobius chulae TaxID=88201 RepID=A0AAW0N3W0_9GOBI